MVARSWGHAQLLVVHFSPQPGSRAVGEQLERLQLPLGGHRLLERRLVARQAAQRWRRVRLALLVRRVVQVVPLQEADEREAQRGRDLPVPREEAGSLRRFLLRRSASRRGEAPATLDAHNNRKR